MNIPCTTPPHSVQLDGSLSSDSEGGDLYYRWTTNCPSGTFSVSDEVVSPLLSFNGIDSNGKPVSCSVQLTVMNSSERTVSCSAVVTVDVCQYDCAGTLNGTKKFDRCGVCDGDGTSCLGCESVDIKQQLFALDGQALAQKKLVRHAADSVIRNRSASKNAVRAAKSAKAAAAALYQEAWTQVWRQPQISTLCENQIFCTQIDNSDALQSMVGNSLKFGDLLNQVLKQLKRLPGGTRSAQQFLKSYKKLHQANLDQVAKVPTITSACSS